jgi:hypothetical protein
MLHVTQINGLRLAYRGLIIGLAAGYVWLAAAMLGAILAAVNPVEPLYVLGGGRSQIDLAQGIALHQLGSGGIGMVFAYFFARYFTVRPTLAAAGPCFAVLSWLLVSPALGVRTDAAQQAILLLASVAYGTMLGLGLPVRGEVTRPSPR